MSTKYSVTALDRRGIGHPNYHCARRAWPSGQEVIVEVLDQDEDPMLEAKDKEGVVRSYPDPLRMGRLSFAEIHHGPESGLLMVRPVGNAPEEAEALQNKIADLQKSAAGATARAELAEREVARIKAESEEHATQRVAWMDTANKHFTEVEALKIKVAELETQLDEATSPALPVGPDHPAAPSVEIDLDAHATPEELRKAEHPAHAKHAAHEAHGKRK